MAYIREINMNSVDSHQTNPGYLLTVIRWDNRDTFNYTGNNLAVRRPLTIYNDAISVTVNVAKATLTPSLSAILLAGDLNYSTAISPGDFVLCNIVNDETKISINRRDRSNTLRNRAVGLRSINGYYDGFKGLFKVQSCKRKIMTDEQTGIKTVVYDLQAFGFTEFNNNIYYDPRVFNELTGRYRIFQQQFDKFWGTLVSGKAKFGTQELLELLIKALIGQGLKNTSTKLSTPEVRNYKIPESVGHLMGIPDAKYAADIYNYVFGIWRPSTSINATPEKGFNPNITGGKGGVYTTGKKLQGNRILAAEYWNNVKVWSILDSYSNNVINELYTTYRVNPDGKVMPTVIARQKPFTPEHTKTWSPTTKFLDLPRWKISPDLIYGLYIGREEAARINFVQIRTRSVSINDDKSQAEQTGKGNFIPDIEDIVRSGLRPYLATANFDFPATGDKTTKGKLWAGLVSEWLFGGHLKEAGTIQCVGIEEPISVGDNFELDGIVYHLEALQHTLIMSGDGKKKFRTNLTVSFGTDKRSNKLRPVYPEMDFTDAHSNRVDDFKHEKILPGYSDTQDVIGRTDGEELKETQEKSFTLAPVPKRKPEGKTDGTTDKPQKESAKESKKKKEFKSLFD